jgi:hypothetical protein
MRKMSEINLYGRQQLSLLFAVLLSLSVSRVSADELIPDMSAEYIYRVGYSSFKGHKAFAIGPLGAVGYSYEWAGRKSAEREALASCKREEAKIRAKETATTKGNVGECRLLASGDKLLMPNPWAGPAWHEPSEGPDRPFERGKSRVYLGSNPKGIVLYLHGCDGLGSDKLQTANADFFSALGYSYFAPDSFGEPRPAAICGPYPQSKRRDRAQITKLRIAQTLRTIRELKLKYPDQPIYLWGHSEGGYIVKMLNIDVAGIIASGDACDVHGIRMNTRKSVPVMIINGENDPFHGSLTLPLTLDKMKTCKKYGRNNKMQFVVLKNNNHFIYPWRKEFYESVSKFLGVTDFKFPTLRKKENFTLNANQKAELNKYSLMKRHRAFAATSKGTFSWSEGWEFKEDAEQFVLFDCADFDAVNVFKHETQHCHLIDVDGNKPGLQ